jgi:hypothetical protein
MEVALRFDGKTIAGVGFELYQNQPNPFVNKTFVGFNLPEAAAATLTVYDETGRAVFTQKGDFAKGYNAISLGPRTVEHHRRSVLHVGNCNRFCNEEDDPSEITFSGGSYRTLFRMNGFNIINIDQVGFMYPNKAASKLFLQGF